MFFVLSSKYVSIPLKSDSVIFLSPILANAGSSAHNTGINENKIKIIINTGTLCKFAPPY